MDKQELESLLSRLRESALFLIKADAIFFAGIFALVGAFKLDLKQALEIGGYLVWAIKLNISLLILSLVYEGAITSITRNSDSSKNASIAKYAQFGYLLLVILHGMAAAYALGYTTKFLELFSQGSS